ncbi:hypothetical protein HRI_001748300 [Hibiscus trionum]|uniref:E3 ubiquitin protein ligase n=1 Tax=Hibiscus trionum TaxID=183268 RepID=A0A9W7HMX1_HIBTR|nr:hypothetical protein HRI_001748300 [Hibiscus trionum]
MEVGEDLPLDYGDFLPLPDPNQRRRAGILLHPTSFRGPYGIGDLGEQAFHFVDWLHLAGCSVWHLDTAVLQFQNQKLVQKLEAQKVEYSTLENKFIQLKEKQKPYDFILKVVNKSWEALITDLESSSTLTRKSSGQDVGCTPNAKDGPPCLTDDAFLSRLMETGATESSSSNNFPEQIKEDREHTASEKTGNILHNIIVAIDDLWCLKDGLYVAVRKELQNDGSCRQLAELESEIKNLRTAIYVIHLKHGSLARQLQSHRDTDAKNKADLKQLKGELESAVVELQESNCKLAALKAERDATNGAFFPVLKLGSKHGSGDKVKDKHRNLHEMESSLKELLEQASSRLTELQSLHEERIKILQQLSNLQLVLEGLRAKQLQDTLLLEKHTMEKEIQQASASLDFYNMKAARIEDQLRFCSDQVQKLGEERFQKSVSLENTQKRLSDIRRSSHQARESSEDSQLKIEKSRTALVES